MLSVFLSADFHFGAPHRARLSFVSGRLGQNREAIATARWCAPMPRTCSNEGSNKPDCRRTIRLTHSGQLALVFSQLKKNLGDAGHRFLA
jgi:hypothetical protein